MSIFISLLKFVRIPNLLIVGLTQYLLRYCILEPYYQIHQVKPALDGFEFFLLVLTTIIIAAGGYIINDLYDYHIDKINKPEKVYVGRVFPQKVAWRMYYGCNLLGLLIAVFLAYKVENLMLVFLFPLFALPLWMYSYKLKKMALIGNVLVSFFCAMVAVLVLFAERAAYLEIVNISTRSATYIFYLFMGYANFAFYSTMFREIVKDIEDVEGDRSNDCKTLPIVLGISRAKMIASLFAFVLLGFLFYTSYWHLKYLNFMWIGLVYLVVGVVFPLLLAIVWLQGAERKEDFHRLSSLAKYIMLAGIIYLPVFWLLVRQ